MTITAPQSQLIMNSFMTVMRNQLAATGLVDWEMHSAEMNDRNGFVVSEQVGPEFVITETTGAVADLSTGKQDTVFGSQTYTVNTVFGLSMSASDIESIKTLGDARKSKALNNGTARLATNIDSHIFTVGAQAFPWSTGTWGNNLASPNDFATARTLLAEGASVESDYGLAGVLRHTDYNALANYIYNNNASMSTPESSKAMRLGFKGGLDGIPLKASNNLGRITTGSRTTAVINGAAQNVNYSAAANSGSTGGAYLTQTLNLTLGGGAGGAGQTIAAGEVFSVTTGTAVEAWDPALGPFGQSRGVTQQFVVVNGGTADGAGAVSITIFPAIVVGDGTSTTGAAGVNNAHRTVSAAPDNGATVTFLGSASTTYIPRVLWRKDSMVVHSAPLIKPYTGMGFRRSLADAQRDGVAPLMPRLWLYSDPDTGVHSARFDVFVQAQVRDRWAGVKFFGA